MRIYIVEDDTSVIGVLEDIVEGNQLGTICGDSGGGLADLQQILALAPDLILVDLLMPQKDGIQVVRELKELGCTAKFIMISQVSNKEMVATYGAELLALAKAHGCAFLFEASVGGGTPIITPMHQ